VRGLSVQWVMCRAGQCLHGSVEPAQRARSELHLALSCHLWLSVLDPASPYHGMELCWCGLHLLLGLPAGVLVSRQSVFVEMLSKHLLETVCSGQSQGWARTFRSVTASGVDHDASASGIHCGDASLGGAICNIIAHMHGCHGVR
jgi:hypothetical protein